MAAPAAMPSGPPNTPATAPMPAPSPAPVTPPPTAPNIPPPTAPAPAPTPCPVISPIFPATLLVCSSASFCFFGLFISLKSSSVKEIRRREGVILGWAFSKDVWKSSSTQPNTWIFSTFWPRFPATINGTVAMSWDESRTSYSRNIFIWCSIVFTSFSNPASSHFSLANVNTTRVCFHIWEPNTLVSFNSVCISCSVTFDARKLRQ